MVHWTITEHTRPDKKEKRIVLYVTDSVFSIRNNIITHADGRRVSIAIIRVCDSVILCVFVCLHEKTAETKIAELSTGIVHHDTSPASEY